MFYNILSATEGNLKIILRLIQRYFSWLLLRNDYLLLPVNFYSPIPDIADLDTRKVWSNKSKMSGINFRTEEQLKLLQQLGNKYGHECYWPPTPTTNTEFEFFTENNSFSYGCAAILHSMIRNYQPKKIIEVGSGNSSKIISSAMQVNKNEGVTSEYSIIDPYPSSITMKYSGATHIFIEKVECVDESLFTSLESNDILFIDSGHTVRIGGDVNFLFLDIFPLLKPGVVIHIHDIPLPYEYPRIYYTNPNFRVFWTESYLLQAFLTFNPNFEVLLAMQYLTTNHWEEFCEAFSLFNPDIHKSLSGSFWMRRTTQ